MNKSLCSFAITIAIAFVVNSLHATVHNLNITEIDPDFQKIIMDTFNENINGASYNDENGEVILFGAESKPFAIAKKTTYGMPGKRPFNENQTGYLIGTYKKSWEFRVFVLANSPIEKV